VLERRGGLRLGGHDIFVSTMGGVRVTEPSVDLAVSLAVASAFTDRPLEPWTVAVGEVGLSGEVRDAPDLPRRLDEAARLGFRSATVPAGHAATTGASVALSPVRDVSEALEHIGRRSSGDAARANAQIHMQKRERLRRSHMC